MEQAQVVIGKQMEVFCTEWLMDKVCGHDKFSWGKLLLHQDH